MKIVLVNCKLYNKTPNALFIMKSTDDRLGNGNWEFLADGERKGSIFTTVAGVKYKVFYDWSVKRID